MVSVQQTLKTRKIVAIDTETYGNIKKHSVYHPSITPRYISYWTDDGKGEVLDCETDMPKIRKVLGKFMGSEYVCVFWNGAFDIPVLEKIDIKPNGCLVQDAMLLAMIVHPLELQVGLKHMARKFLKVPYLEEDAIKAYMRKHKCDYGAVPYDVMYPYAIADAQYTFELFYLMLGKLDRLEMWPTWELESACYLASLRMMKRGIRVDHDKVLELMENAVSHKEELRRQICREAGRPGFNPNSDVQVRDMLWPEGAKSKRFAGPITKGGKLSTNNLSLLLDGRDIAKKIQLYRKYSKAISTYYEALLDRPVDGVLHCSLNQARAITGRYSSSGPNLQNQPRPAPTPLGRIRECFVPHDDNSFLLLIDFDQIELRLAAHFGSEKHMIEDILNGRDLHSGTCKRMFNKDEEAEDFKRYRYLAKRLNFGTLYGTGPAKFASTVLEDSNGDFRIDQSEAAVYIRKWWDAHPGIAELRNRVFSEVARTGGVRTHFGRFIPVESWKDHAALNYLIQGTAADIIKRAIVRVERLLKKERARTQLLLPVHDELIFNMPREEKRLVSSIVEVMQETREFRVPLTCSVEAGLRWGTKKPVVITR